MPEGAVYVGRPTKWGNPFKYPDWLRMAVQVQYEDGTKEDLAVGHYRSYVTDPAFGFVADALIELRGKDLVCWCAIDVPCHADVLLEIANP